MGTDRDRLAVAGTFDGVRYTTGRVSGASVDLWTDDGRRFVAFDVGEDPQVFEGTALGGGPETEVLGPLANHLLALAASARAATARGREEGGSR